MLYVFGNDALEDDGFALEVARSLGVAFEHLRSPDLLLEAEGEIVILDVVRGITEPIVIRDPGQLRTRRLLSLHDFDVGYFLTLLERLGMLESIMIIGVPQQGDPERIAHEVSRWIHVPA